MDWTAMSLPKLVPLSREDISRTAKKFKLERASIHGWHPRHFGLQCGGARGALATIMNIIKDETTERMQKCMDSLSNQFSKIRTGRANPSILDSVKVDYYGNQTPINQTANISVEENRTLVISPWDKTLMPEIEKAIISSDLGLNPSSSGDLIRITMPALTEETRQDYIKQARTEAENARISIRSVRRDSNQSARDLNTKSELSDDELRDLEVEVQEITDKFISMIDDQLKHKEDDLIQI